VRFKKITNPTFTNKRSVGQYQSVSFDTYVALPGGKEDVSTVAANIHYCQKGEGEVILLLHGAGQSYYTFHKNLAALAQKHRVIAIDLLGHGYSDCPDMAYTIEEHVLAIEAFLKALGIEKLSIVGIGQGAAYGLLYACYHPEDVGKVVIIHPGALMEIKFPLVKSLRRPLWNRTLSKLSRPAVVAQLMDKFYFDRTIIAPQSAEEYARPLEDPDVRAGVRLTVCNYDEDELVSHLAAYAGQVLCISAPDDPIHNKKDQESILSHLENAYYVDIRNCGYLVHEEKPQTVNQEILEFLRRS